MAGMKELARLVRELEDQLMVCMRCGMCQAVCPLYGQTGREADVARGKLALLDGLSREIFKNPDGVAERLNRCLLCGSCAANCPSGVKVLDIFLKARAILAGYRGLPPAKRIIFRGILAHPQTFDRLLEWAARFQKFVTKPASETLGTSCARFVSPLLSDRHITPLARQPFHSTTPSMDSAAGRSGLRVAYFVGCLIDKVFPHVADASIQVLQHHGVGIYLPAGQACCGIPAASSGDRATFKNLVKQNLARLEASSYDHLVTACATCTSTIKKLWPALLEDETAEVRERIQRISDKTMDIHQFLVSQVGLDPAETKSGPGRPIVVTYHDPCHLKKSLGVAREPRECIGTNSDYRLQEMAEPDWCCGFGGSFNLEHYELSAEIGRRKRDAIVATGCGVVSTGCPACMIQLNDMLSQAGERIRVKHAIEIYAERLVKR